MMPGCTGSAAAVVGRSSVGMLRASEKTERKKEPACGQSRREVQGRPDEPVRPGSERLSRLQTLLNAYGAAPEPARRRDVQPSGEERTERDGQLEKVTMREA